MARYKPNKYENVEKEILKIYEKSYKAYGYRRIQIDLRKEKIFINHKTTLKLMRSLKIRGKIKKKKYNSFRGAVSNKSPNLIDRNFKATKPYEKLTTDVSQFNVCGEKIYLSPILDMYSNEIVSYSISTSPNMAQIKQMMEGLFKNLPEGAEPILHSDQGWQYWQDDYCNLLKSRNIKQSMSRKGNCLDNSIMESFFGRLKVEMFYGEKFENKEDFIARLRKYIDYYNSERISLKLNGLSPIQYRNQFLKN